MSQAVPSDEQRRNAALVMADQIGDKGPLPQARAGLGPLELVADEDIGPQQISKGFGTGTLTIFLCSEKMQLMQQDRASI